jgi:hypothetical protein
VNNLTHSTASSCPPTTSVELCPFHDGPETLDGLLAEISPRENELLDAALDLRQLITQREDAEAVLAQLFRLRGLLDGRHYLAFYRLRCWLQRLILVQARAYRGEVWQTFLLPLDGARIDEIIDSTLARLVDGPDVIPGAHVRFVFAAMPTRMALKRFVAQPVTTLA